MVTRIDSLTGVQEQKLAEWREMWLKIGLSCEPCDLERAKVSVGEVYAAAGLAAPKLFIVCDSPVSAAITAVILRDPKGRAVWDQVRAQVGAQVWDQVGAQVRAQVGDQVWDQVGAQVRAQVWDQVRAQVWAQVRAQVWAQVWDQVGAQVRDQVWDQVFGSHDAGWLSYFDYFDRVCNLESCSRMRGLIGLAQVCGWWAPYRNLVILQHRHSEVHRNDLGRLHNPAGMAVKYRDGFGVWAINGVRVDEQIIMRPESQTVEQIRGDANEEIRRIRIERFGWDRYLTTTNAKVIDAEDDIDGIHQALMRTDKETVLCCACPSTGRAYAIEVAPSCRTIEQAQLYLLAPTEALSGIAPHEVIRKIKPMPILQS